MDPQTAQVLTASIAVIGALGGAALGAGATYLLERGRRQREDRHRFTSERRAAYSRVLTVLDSIDSRVISKVEFAVRDSADLDLSSFQSELDQCLADVISDWLPDRGCDHRASCRSSGPRHTWWADGARAGPC